MANLDTRYTRACQRCGGSFFKRRLDSMKQWGLRQFCSMTCNNRSRPIKPLSERFWEKVQVRTKNSCWVWTGSLDNRGYPKMSQAFRESPLKAHRVSWELHFGEIPGGLFVLHACDNPSCVNPNHLMLGTAMANSVDMSRKGRVNGASLLNLRTGKQGIHGAGPISQKEMQIGVS